MIVAKTGKLGCPKCNQIIQACIVMDKLAKGAYKCEDCGTVMIEVNDFKNKSYLLVDKTLGYYDNQLGAYIESSSDKRKLLKRKGLVEVKSGTNDYVSKVHDKSDKEKHQEYVKILKDNAYKNNIPIHGMN